jgi:hypothetical protein
MIELALFVVAVGLVAYFVLRKDSRKDKDKVHPGAVPVRPSVTAPAPTQEEDDMFSLKKLMAGSGGGSGGTYDITVGFWITGEVPSLYSNQGYVQSIAEGSISPSPAYLNGREILSIYVYDTFMLTGNLLISVSGDGLSQDFFTRFYHPNIGWKNTADADVFVSSGTTYWEWRDGIPTEDMTAATVIFE